VGGNVGETNGSGSNGVTVASVEISAGDVLDAFGAGVVGAMVMLANSLELLVPTAGTSARVQASAASRRVAATQRILFTWLGRCRINKTSSRNLVVRTAAIICLNSDGSSAHCAVVFHPLPRRNPTIHDEWDGTIGRNPFTIILARQVYMGAG